MWDGFNQRKFPRVGLNCEISIEPEPDAPPIKAVTDNVGEGGVCVIQHHPLERFSRCQVRLELAKNQPIIECGGKIVWLIERREQSSGQPKSYDTGIEFVDIKPEDRERIRAFILEFLPKGFQKIV